MLFCVKFHLDKDDRVVPGGLKPQTVTYFQIQHSKVEP